MKTTYIIVLVLVSVCVGIIFSGTTNASQYINFKEAINLAQAGSKEKFHVVGELLRDEKKQIKNFVYQPTAESQRMVFSFKDETGEIKKVVCHDITTQITDVYRAEKMVLIGRFLVEEDYFLAKKILLKCPSKYKK